MDNEEILERRKKQLDQTFFYIKVPDLLLFWVPYKVLKRINSCSFGIFKISVFINLKYVWEVIGLSYYRCLWSGEKSWINHKKWREQPGTTPHHSALEPLDFSWGTTPELDLAIVGLLGKPNISSQILGFWRKFLWWKNDFRVTIGHTTNDPDTVTFLWKLIIGQL